MKENFIYVLSALLVVSVVLMQISTQAVTNAKDNKTMPQFEKDIKHLERDITSEGKNLKNKKEEETKSEKTNTINKNSK